MSTTVPELPSWFGHVCRALSIRGHAQPLRGVLAGLGS
jgi:hypothetical protein